MNATEVSPGSLFDWHSHTLLLLGQFHFSAPFKERVAPWRRNRPQQTREGEQPGRPDIPLINRRALELEWSPVNRG